MYSTYNVNYRLTCTHTYKHIHMHLYINTCTHACTYIHTHALIHHTYINTMILFILWSVKIILFLLLFDSPVICDYYYILTVSCEKGTIISVIHKLVIYFYLILAKIMENMNRINFYCDSWLENYFSCDLWNGLIFLVTLWLLPLMAPLILISFFMVK